MNRLGPSPVNHYDASMELVDSVSLGRAHPRFCWFRYEDECDEKKVMNAPCYEFYFDTPQKINRVMDTFYVGRYNEISMVPTFGPIEYGGEYSSSYPSTIYHSVDYTEDYLDLFLHCRGYQDRKWGVAFPIIGFRCGPISQYWIDTCTAAGAVVRWRNVEEGTLFNVRLVGDDGSDTTYTTADTSISLTGLDESVRYNVMVRKQCHYATSNYDTTVYSEWLSYLSFGTTILDTVWRTVDANSANPAMGTVIGGGMYMDSSVVTLTARSLGNSEFDIWNDGDTTNPRQIFVISDTSFTAFFREKEDTVGIILPEGEDFVLNPNPAHGTIQVIVPTSTLGEQLSICNLAGRELRVFDIQHQSFNINIGTLPSGVYLVKLTTPSGPTTKKLLVQ